MKKFVKKAAVIILAAISIFSCVMPVLADSDTSEIYQSFYSITVKMQTAGNLASKTKEFGISIQMPDKYTGRVFAAVRTDAEGKTEDTYLTADSSGRVSFTLKKNETMTVEGLDRNEISSLSTSENYGVSEKDFSSDGYSVSYIKSGDGENLCVTVTGKRDSYVPSGIHAETGIEIICSISTVLLVFLLLAKEKGGKGNV